MRRPTPPQLVAIVALIARPGAADLPVHCLRHQVSGDWEFTLGPLGPKRTSCGHQRPDNAYQQPSSSSLGGDSPAASKRFSLLEPNEARTEGDDESGTWTMIYDEGFEVRSGNFVYFAFSKFDFVSDGAGGKRNVSHCGETQLGWYHDVARTRWGCYFGKKVEPAGGDASAQPSPAYSKKVALPVLATSATDLDGVPPEYIPWVPGSAGYDKPTQGEWRKNVAQALNFLQLGWTATAYDDKFGGRSPRELNRLAGVRRGRLPSLVRNDSAEPIPRHATSFLAQQTRKHTAKGQRHESGHFDWRQHEGRSFLTPVVEQGDCGSCYTIATIHMLTARHRIRKGNPEAPEFSISFPLYCSEYNQGCDGGYGFLQSKWSEDVGLVPAPCAPFSQGGGQCQVEPGCELGAVHHRAVNHRYVGGYYGGATEASIREELVRNGPLVISFEPKEDFMYYQSGVYRSGPARLHQEWEQVDHAVLLVAYGSADVGGPYWTMQNSWGEDWGEAGYFRMARGGDESGCESIAVAADVAEEGENEVLQAFLASL